MIRLSRQSAASAAISAARPLYRLLKLTLSRFYTTASAAQPLLDRDYFEKDGSDGGGVRLGAAAAMLDAECSVPRRGVQWAFIGCPGAMRSVYAETLSKLLEVPRISMATLVRQELHPRSSLYEQIADAVNRRELVPEDIIFGLLSKRLEDGYYRGETGFILDGIPRSRFQAEIVDQLAEIDLVVNFICNEDYLMQYQGEKAWKDKVKAYFEQIKPLEDYYQKRKKLLDFKVGIAPADTWPELLAALHLQHVQAVFSSKKLPAASNLFETS